jgi:hypothetical protein
MKTGNILLLLFIGIVLLSCESDEISSAKMYVKEIGDPVVINYKDQFEYEGEHLILFKRFFGETLSTITKFEYQNDQLKRVESKVIDVIDFLVELEHNSEGQIIKEKVTFPDLRDSTRDLKIIILSDFTYYDDGNLRTKKSIYSDSSSYPTETEFEWENGNLVKMNVSFIDNLGKKITLNRSMTYDSKRNYSNQDWAFVYVSAIPADEMLIALSKNNSLSTTENLLGQTSVRVLSTFSYNRNGYPIEYKSTNDGFEESPRQVKYE